MKPQLEVVPHQLDSSLSAFKYEEAYFEAPWHYHQELELTYVIKSSGVRYVGNSIQNFQEGDLVLIGPSLPHAWKNGPSYSGGASSIYLQWGGALLTDHIQQIPEFKSIKRLLQKAQYGVSFPANQQSMNYGFRMEELLLQKKGSKVLQFLDLLYDLSREKNYELLTRDGAALLKFQETDSRIKDIINFLNLHYQKHISLEEIANLTCMTKPAFCKFFKNIFKKTFTTYLNEFRINHVCQELQSTSLPLMEIAMNCGYENMSYFHRQFKNIVGLTPAEYRKQFRII